MTKQFVPASRSDVKANARIMVKFDRDHQPAKGVDRLYGRAVDAGTVKRGDLQFMLEVGAISPVRIRHGDYTGTEIHVEVDVEARIASLTAALKRGYKARERVVMVTLVGGPLDSATVPLTACHTPWNTLPITCKGQTGHYQSARWVPA